MLNNEFIFERHKERYNRFWNKNLKLRNDLNWLKVDNCYALPPIAKENPFGVGGILSSALEEVKESHMYNSGANIMMRGSYPIDQRNAKVLHGEFIYLGFIFNHLGHFIVDFSTRLYFAQQHPDMNCVFLVSSGSENFSLIPPLHRFIELSGINPNKITFISQVCKIESLIIPEQSYIASSYYSCEYLDTFNVVANSIEPNANKAFDKVFFSRTKHNSSYKKEIGSDLLDNIFAACGYTIIYPEIETLDNQIYYLRNAKQFAAVSGSIFHSMMFAQNQDIEVFVVNKAPYVNTLVMESLKFANLVPMYLDFYAYKYPTNLGKGPFIFLFNDIMLAFIKKYNVTITKELALSITRVKENIITYGELYSKRYPDPRWKRDINTNPDLPQYYDPELLIDWLNKYSRYETQDFNACYANAASDTEDSASILRDILVRYVDTGAAQKPEVKPPSPILPQLICSWTTTDGNSHSAIASSVCGSIGHSAPGFGKFRLSCIHGYIPLHYQSVCKATGWSEVVRTGQFSFTKDSEEPILGLKIWPVTSESKITIMYRAYAQSWSAWAANGQELVCASPITAIQVRAYIS